MRGWPARFLLAVLIGAAGAPSASGQDVQKQVRILVPAFAGEARLGLATANLLRLQVSSTFQVAGTDTRAMMVFDDRPLLMRTHESAQDRSVDLGTLSHLILWGQSYEYPDGVVVQAHLSTSPWLQERADRPELWAFDIAGEEVGIAVELPRELYEFPPVVLSLEAAKHYQELDGLIIYRDRAGTQPVGRFRDIFRAYEYHPDAVRLESGGARGWVPLPHVWRERSEIVDFVGGYIRLLRGDWPGAAQLFRSVLEREDITPEMRIDSNLFLGLAAEKQGRSGLRALPGRGRAQRI